jgi:hypothetical protein
MALSVRFACTSRKAAVNKKAEPYLSWHNRVAHITQYAPILGKFLADWIGAFFFLQWLCSVGVACVLIHPFNNTFYG